MGMEYYIGQAGGYTDLADHNRVSVTYKNGERAVVERVLFHRRTPEIRPGSTILVPARPEGPKSFDWDQFLSRTLSIVSTTLTLLIAAKSL
jgi:hypothetical protein